MNKINDTDMSKKDDKEVNIQASQHLECYCCKKEKKESEGDWIVAGKDKTSGSIEKRFVCKKCNYLEKK